MKLAAKSAARNDGAAPPPPQAETVKLMRRSHLEGGKTLSDPGFNTHLVGAPSAAPRTADRGSLSTI